MIILKFYEEDSWSLEWDTRVFRLKTACFDILLTVHLSIILAIDQLNAQILVL